MGKVQHVFKRGSIYWWRRRLPIGTDPRASLRIELSLNTKELNVARAVALEVTRASIGLAAKMKQTMISKNDARRILAQVALQHTEYLDSLSAVRLGRDPNVVRRSDLSTGWAWRLLAAQGDHARVGEMEERELRDAGLDDMAIAETRKFLEFLKTSGFGRPSREVLEKLLAANGIPAVERHIKEAEELYLRGRAAAHLNTERRVSGVRHDDVALLKSALANPELAEPDPDAASSYPLYVKPWRPPAPRSEAQADEVVMQPIELVVESVEQHDSREPSRDVQDEPTPTKVVSFIEILRKAGQEKTTLKDWRPDVARQHLSVAKLFARYLGHDNPADVCQSDIAGFRSLLFKLPKSHGKSPKDHSVPLSDLLKRSESLPTEQVGMASATINRYMTQINNLAEICRAFGAPFGDFDGVARLRSRKKGNARDDRAGFTTEELETLLGLPVWHGSASEDDRFAAGGLVFHDSSYWVPLLAIYTGARREELCGLLVSDIEKGTERPFIRIEENKLRGVKNQQSKRRVPLHPELIRLGFLNYVTAIINAGHDVLFPDLLTETGATPMGDVFDDQWQKMRALALPLAKEEGKVLHSLRHWCNDAMKQKLVSSEIRRDILGHGTGDMNEGRYANPAMIAVMSTALSALPLVSRNIQAQPIRLTSRVIAHRLRPTKKRKSSG